MAQIDIREVSVEFPIYNIRSRSFKNQFLRLATGGTIARDAHRHIVVKSLNHISLSLRHGDRVGLIGHNGAGKSTLLKLISNIYEPSRGQMRVDGAVSSLLNIMQGIEAEFTGYENINIRGTILGLTKKEIQDKTDDIVELTGLGDYLAMPVRTYSSGMMVRLAFAISTSINPDILLIDEVFGAGDADFMQRARSKMVSLLNQSSIVVLASHADNLINEFCNKCILMEGGKIKFFGDVSTALSLYRSQ